MSGSTTFSIRIDADMLERIDQAAERAGENRSTYILSWVPEYHDTPRTPHSRDTVNGPRSTQQEHRGS